MTALENVAIPLELAEESSNAAFSVSRTNLQSLGLVIDSIITLPSCLVVATEVQ